MRKPSIDYSKYSREDLESALAGIDRERYPDNYRALLQALKAGPPDTVPSLPPPVEAFIRSGDSRIEKPAPMPVGYARLEKPDGSLLLRQQYGVLSVIPLAIFLAMIFLTLSSEEGASNGFEVLFFFIFLAFTSVHAIARRSVLLEKERLIVRYGVGKWMITKYHFRSEIRFVRLDHDTSGDNDTYNLVIGCRQERDVGFTGEKDATFWLGSEIAAWAGVPYLKSREEGWTLFKWRRS